MAFPVKPEAALASRFRNILQDMHPIFNSNDLLRFWGIDRDLKTLEKTLKRIQDVLNDAEWRSQTEEGVSDWMDDLRELLYCIENFVDKMNIERDRIKKQLAAKNEAASTAQNQLAASLYTLGDIMADCTSQKKQISESIKEIIGNLEEVAKDAKELNLKPQALVTSFAVKDGEDIGPLVDESEIYGRQEDKDHVIKLLMNRNDSSRNYSVVSIVGMGGVGKTTLARDVFGDERVKSHFYMQSWACVSDDFDFSRVVRELIEYISEEKPSKMTTAALLGSLKSMVTAKKVLFVLDDMWTVVAWEKLKGAFTHCAEGSKILVTTRDKNIGHAINDKEIYELQTLEGKYCLDLFKEKAFGREVDERLERIGEKIVERCKGVPLAVKVIGSSLRFASEEMWESTLNNEIWESMDVAKNGIFPVLKLSYHYLPSSLKRCFQYFAVFPTDYWFKRDNLVRLWIAEGLIESREGGMLEEIGCSYYIELQRRCIIQENDRMHDLLHSLACLVSGKFFRQSAKGSKSYTLMRSIRHLSLIDKEVNIEMFDEATCLCTLLVLGQHLFDEINLKWTLLRVLDLSDNDLWELPSSVGNLKHLRYLNLSWCSNLQSLPDSICELHNLQTLDLSACRGMRGSALPTHMGNLENLRFLSLYWMSKLSALPNSIVKLSNLLTLDLEDCVSLTCMPDNIGGLQSLQTLWLKGCRSISHLPSEIGNLQHLRELRLGGSSISCLPESLCNIRNLRVLDISGCKSLNSLPRDIGNLTCIQKLGRFVVGRKEGHGIELLKDMNKLQGELVISCLANLQSVEHALMANLKKKVLDEIHFDWGNEGHESHDSINDLEDDDISDVVVRDLEARVLDALEPHPTSLKSLSFLNYRGRRFPKWLSALSFPILKELVLKGLNGINRMVDLELPSLQRLEIKSCINLEDVSMGVPKLISFVVLACRDLTTLAISPSLGNSISSLASSILDLPQLKEITFGGCSSLRDICMGLVPGMEELMIEDSKELKMIYVDHMPNLRILKLKSLPNLTLHGGLHPGSSLQSIAGQVLPPVAGDGMFPILRRLDVLDKIRFDWGNEGHNSINDLEDDDISDVDRDLEARVLDALEPHPTSLKSLSFFNYRGGRIPKWLSALSFPILKNLVMKGLEGINRMVDLELPSLERLEIESCLKLRDVSMGVPNLISLVVLASRDLTTLSISPSLGNSSSSLASSISDLPQLKELNFSGCSSLRDICMGLVPGMEELMIEDCKELKMIYVDHMPNLRILKLKSLPNLTLLGGLHPGSSSSLTSLKELSISSGCEHELMSLAMQFDCEAHRSDDLLLPVAGGGMFPILRELNVEECPKLKFSPEWLCHFTSLESFTFSGTQPEAQKVASLQNLPRLGTKKIMGIAGQVLPLVEDDEAGSLPKALLTIASLRKLRIRQCPELVSFPETGLPPLLQELHVSSCKNLQYFPTGLNDHTSLQKLCFLDCEQVEARPDDGPSPNFERLSVINCPKLEKQIEHRIDWLAKMHVHKDWLPIRFDDLDGLTKWAKADLRVRKFIRSIEGR